MRSPLFFLQISLQLDWFAESFVVPTTHIGAQSGQHAMAVGEDQKRTVPTLILGYCLQRPYFWFPDCQCLSLGLMDLSILKWSINHWIPFKVTCFSMAAPLLLPEISLDLSTHILHLHQLHLQWKVVTLSLSALSCLDQPTLTPFYFGNLAVEGCETHETHTGSRFTLSVWQIGDP